MHSSWWCSIIISIHLILTWLEYGEAGSDSSTAEPELCVKCFLAWPSPVLVLLSPCVYLISTFFFFFLRILPCIFLQKDILSHIWIFKIMSLKMPTAYWKTLQSQDILVKHLPSFSDYLIWKWWTTYIWVWKRSIRWWIEHAGPRIH